MASMFHYKTEALTGTIRGLSERQGPLRMKVSPFWIRFLGPLQNTAQHKFSLVV